MESFQKIIGHPEQETRTQNMTFCNFLPENIHSFSLSPPAAFMCVIIVIYYGIFGYVWLSLFMVILILETKAAANCIFSGDFYEIVIFQLIRPPELPAPILRGANGRVHWRPARLERDDLAAPFVGHPHHAYCLVDFQGVRGGRGGGAQFAVFYPPGEVGELACPLQ